MHSYADHASTLAELNRSHFTWLFVVVVIATCMTCHLVKIGLQTLKLLTEPVRDIISDWNVMCIMYVCLYMYVCMCIFMFKTHRFMLDILQKWAFM